MNISLNNLQKYLSSKKYDASIQEETDQVLVLLKISGHDFPLFLRIFDDSDLLQLLVFMPTNIKPGTHSDLARLLHLLNKELDIPGFGMDEAQEVVFYRYMLPIPGKKIEEELLESYIKSIELICESISSSVIAVAAGVATYSEILRKIKENQANQTTIKP